VHDYFEILGLPSNARASEIRRACARRVHVAHPDFRGGSTGVLTPPPPVDRLDHDVPSPDAAIDFVDAAAFVERMQTAFFSRP
jgi:hypothetical protein